MNSKIFITILLKRWNTETILGLRRHQTLQLHYAHSLALQVQTAWSDAELILLRTQKDCRSDFKKTFSEGWDMTTSARQSWWAQSAPGDTFLWLWGCSLQGSDHTSHTPCRRCTSSSWWRSFRLDQLLRSQVGGRSSRSLKMTKSAERKVTFGQNSNFQLAW